jgi:hypothetical protein
MTEAETAYWDLINIINILITAFENYVKVRLQKVFFKWQFVDVSLVIYFMFLYLFYIFPYYLFPDLVCWTKAIIRRAMTAVWFSYVTLFDSGNAVELFLGFFSRSIGNLRTCLFVQNDTHNNGLAKPIGQLELVYIGNNYSRNISRFYLLFFNCYNVEAAWDKD